MENSTKATVARILEYAHLLLSKGTQSNLPRITTKEWKNILLENEDTFTHSGYIWKMLGKRIGPGVYEITFKRR